MTGFKYLKESFSSKRTGIVVYCKDKLAEFKHIFIHSKPTISESDSIISSYSSNKGAACLILNIYSIKILLMSIDITDYNKLETFMTKCDEKVKKEYQHII
eukprot:356883_1